MGWTSKYARPLEYRTEKDDAPEGAWDLVGKGHQEAQCHEIYTHRELRSPSVWTDSYADLDYNDFYYNISSKQRSEDTNISYI